MSDLSAAKQFYTQKLGFSADFEWGEPVSYVGLERGPVALHLIDAGHSRQKPGTGNISIVTDAVDAYFDRCKSGGVDILVEPNDRAYGLRDFSLRDPDGNVLNFGCEV